MPDDPRKRAYLHARKAAEHIQAMITTQVLTHTDRKKAATLHQQVQVFARRLSDRGSYKRLKEVNNETA